MVYMLCRNKVNDFDHWKAVMASHAGAHQQAGLRLVTIWRKVEERDNVFFLFEVESIDKAVEFINSPESAKAGEETGVVDGEYHFIEDVGGY